MHVHVQTHIQNGYLKLSQEISCPPLRTIWLFIYEDVHTVACQTFQQKACKLGPLSGQTEITSRDVTMFPYPGCLALDTTGRLLFGASLTPALLRNAQQIAPQKGQHLSQLCKYFRTAMFPGPADPQEE